jgi:hypothetical protein
MKPTGIRPAVALAVLVALAAACGDDSGSPFASSTSTADGSTTTAQGTTTSRAGGSTTSIAEGETTSTAGLPGDAGDIEELLERFREVPLRTTYLMGDEPDRQEITFSQDPTLNPPASAVLFEGGKLITFEDRYIVCSGEGAGSQCFETPASEGVNMATAMLGPFAALALSLQGMTDTPGVEVETEEVTIAGRNGVCFTYRPEAVTGSDLEFARQCIDGELGFALLLEVKEAGSDEVKRVLELLAMGQPEPGDFEPTGPVIPLPEG